MSENPTPPPQISNLAEKVAELTENDWHQSKPITIIGPDRVVNFATLYITLETDDAQITLYKVPGENTAFLYIRKILIKHDGGKFDPRKSLEPEEEDRYISFDEGSLILWVWQRIDLTPVTI